jgi:hypothetical protein
VSAAAICPCDVFVHPRPISNLPGLDAIDYRGGDWTSFRHALLLSRPDEAQLVNWRPSAKTDLALQLVEWWAYLADILTLYDERIANESYLRTADLPESLNRLIRTLGYRPRPGIGAHGVVAARATGRRPPTLPAGFQIQSKPGPGTQPQIFELSQAVSLRVPDAVPADPPADGSLTAGAQPGALLAGTITSVRPNDELLVVARSWPGSGGYALTKAQSVEHRKGPHGEPQTFIAFAGYLSGLADPQASDYRLLAAPLTARPYAFTVNSGFVFTSTAIHLDSVVRGIAPGSPVLLENAGGSSPAPQLVAPSTVTEVVWYANASASSPATQPASPAIPLPIPHTQLGFSSLAHASEWDGARGSTVIHHSWRELGPMLARPATQLSGETEATLTPSGAARFPSTNGGDELLLADASGKGATGTVEQGGSHTEITVQSLADAQGNAPTLAAPLEAYFDVLSVSRGATVAGEVLGSGDATAVNQEFTLKKSPLTYLQSGPGYASTLRVWVDGVEWHEAPSFFEQPKDARIFVTREDEQGVTHVTFGDGVEGARLPSGNANVVATYRYGSGAQSPAQGTLNVIVKPLPGLKKIVDPLPVGGGADPDPPDQIRRYAPDSVLTFGRAISVDDYEVIAAQAPGVARARAYWSWDPELQRAVPTVYVGDDGNALQAARDALAGADDPNRPLAVKAAWPVYVWLGFGLEADPDHVWRDVQTAVVAALVDPQTGLLGSGRVRIGASLFRSRISAACLAVPGVVAIHDLSVFTYTDWDDGDYVTGQRIDSGEGGYFRLPSNSPYIWQEAAVAA